MNDGSISSNRIILCHLDRARYDFGYHKEIAQTGAYLEYDTIRREKYHSDAEEIKLISYMIGRGYGGNLLLGMDETNLRLKSYGAPFGMDFILTDFKYQMEREGIDNNIFMRIMKENAANALEFEQ
jgi:phosphotriesterase-related protein